MTDSTGVKEEMHCDSGFLAIFDTIKQRDVSSFQGFPLDPHQGPALDPLEAYSTPDPQLELPSAQWELPSSAKGVTSERQGVTWYLDKF